MKKGRKQILIIASILLLFSVCIFTVSMAGTSVKAAEWSDSALNSEYPINYTLSVPDRTVTDDGKTLLATKSIIFPDGVAYAENADGRLDGTLSKAGKYTVQYFAENDAKQFVSSKSFIVKQTKITKGNYSSLKYGKGRNFTSDALILSLARGETFYFNHAIDVSKLSKAQSLLSFFIDPLSKGTIDASNLYFVLTGAEDSSEKLTIRLYFNQEASSYTYIAACGNGQPMTGMEIFAGAPIYHRNNEFGTPCYLTFDGIFNGETVDSDKYILDLNYDYDENALYASKGLVSEQPIVSDFDSLEYYPNTLWNGFTGGKAFLSIYGDKYLNNTIDICFRSIFGVSNEDMKNCLSGNLLDEQAPNLIVKTDNEISQGRVGYYYPIFDAEAFDVYSGECEVDVKVLYNGKVAVGVNDGKFLIEKQGFYSIIYTSEDDSGNVATRTITVRVDGEKHDIAVTLGEREDTATCGDKVMILPPQSMSGGLGRLTYSVNVKKEGKTTAVTDCFYPETEGEYTIEYVVTDYTGYSKKVSYKVNVTADGVPKLTDNVLLPKYILSGMSYTFGEYYATDYSGASPIKKAVVMEISTPSGKRTYSAGDSYSINDMTDGEATITLKCGSYEFESYTIPVVGAFVDGKLKVENYFVKTLGDYTSNKKQTGIEFVANGDYAWTFAKAIAEGDVSAEFCGKPNSGAFNRLTFTLADSVDESIALTVAFVREGDKYYCSIAGKRIDLSVVFNKTSTSVKFGYINKKLFVGSNYVNANTDEAGNPFDGFPSGKVYFSMKMESDNGVETSIKLEKLCEYPFTKASRDMVAPKLVILGDYGGNYKLGDLYSITPAVASDVLDENVNLTMTVYDPQGRVMTSTDGTRLEKVQTSVEYKIKLELYGQYEVKYHIIDSTNSNDVPYMVNVIDTTPPEFIFNKGFLTSAKVGDVYIIPDFEVKDNLSSADKITMYKYVVNPDGKMIAIEENAFRFKAQGKYTFYITAYDEVSNIKTVKIAVNVSE